MKSTSINQEVNVTNLLGGCTPIFILDGVLLGVSIKKGEYIFTSELSSDRGVVRQDVRGYTFSLGVLLCDTGLREMDVSCLLSGDCFSPLVMYGDVPGSKVKRFLRRVFTFNF